MSRQLPTVRLQFFCLFITVSFLQLFSGKALGQANPTPQTLPFTQNFSTFDGSTATYPAGFQGWTVNGALTTTVLTAAPLGNQSLYGGEDNSTSIQFIGDMVQKIGMLPVTATSTSVTALCLAINTTSVTTDSVQVIYTVGTQGQTAGGYIDEMDLQYRIGTTGTFTTVPGATYRNTATTTTTTAGSTTSYNDSTRYVLLPSSCNNKADVQLRWIMRNVSGTGTTHPSFSISNITVQKNTTTDYYSKSTGNLDNVSTWGLNRDGSGTSPANFTANNQVFHISNGTSGNISAGSWTVSGTNSVIIVDGTNFTNTTSNIVNGVINVNPGMTLTLSNPTYPTLGNLDPLSTVTFANISGILVPTVTSTSGAYGNITFSHSSVALPTGNPNLVFAGNFTLTDSASFIGAVFFTTNNSNGYNLMAYGTNNQLINANGLPLDVWNFDVGSTYTKPLGTVALASNTPLYINNVAIMNLTGASPQFVDSGNIITVSNNLDLSGSASAYDFTGTIYLSSPTYESGTQWIRGGALQPNVAAINNLVLNNAIPAELGGNFTVKGNLIVTDTATSTIEFDGYTIALGGNFTSLNTTDEMVMSAGSQLLFDGTSTQTYTSAVPGGNTFDQVNINNSAGLVLNSQMNIGGTKDTLYLTDGIISTGANEVTIDNKGGVSGANAASYVKGTLSKKMLSAGSTSMVYEVGDTTFSPIKLTFSSSVNSGSISVKSTYGSHPDIATSYINTSNFVNRYWTIASSGVAPATISLALSYNSSDLVGGPNTNYIIRQYAGSTWTTAHLPVTNTTIATAPLQPYASTSTGNSGSSFSGDYIAGAANCTTLAGTTNPSPAFVCGSGSSALSLAGITTATGNTYQWQSSPTGSTWTNISGATNATYTPSVSATTYYECTVGCIATTTTLNSVSAIVSVDPIPSTISGNIYNCAGSSLTLTDATGSGTWSSSNTSVAVIGSSSGSYSGATAGTATISYTLPTSCYTTATIINNALPATPMVSPLEMSFCSSSPAALASTQTYSSYTGTVTATYNAPTLAVNSTVIDTYSTVISGIPLGATITGISVNFNMSQGPGGLQKDDILNLRGPNNAVINLFDKNGSAAIGGFPNIDINSAGTVSMVGATLVAGTNYEAYLSAASVGPTTPAGYKSGVGYNWANLGVGNTGNGELYNGKWTFIQYDNFAVDTFKSWTINISYVVNANVTWSPVAGLYTNTGGVGPAYTTGTSATSVYVLPTATTIYTVTATVGTCSSSSSMPAIYSNPLYVPSIQGLSTLCQGGTIAMTDSASGGTWSSTGAASVSATGVVTGVNAGTATISFALANGCATQYATKVVTVNGAAIDPITGTTNLCLGGIATSILTDAISGGTWTTSNTNITIGSSSGLVTGLSSGSAIITYTLFAGCTITGTINVNTSPSITATVTPDPVCAGATLSFNSTPVGGSGTYSTFVWNGTGVLAGSQNPSITNATIGDGGIYTVTVTDNNGCMGSGVTNSVTVNAAPTITATVTPNPICAGGTLTFNSTPSGGSGVYSTYVWNGTGTLAGSQNPSITGATTGDDGIYTVTVTDNNGCKGSGVTNSVTVNVLPTITATVTPNPICAGGTLSFNSTPVGGGGSYSTFVWSGTGSLAGTQNPSITNAITSDDGVYTVTVTDNNGCKGSGVTTSVTVNSLPTITATVNPNPVCAGGTLSFNSTPVGGSGTYSSFIWTGGGSLSPIQNPSITSAASGDDGVYTVTVTDNNGCRASAITASVTVNPLPAVITGFDSVCVGLTTSLTDATLDGTWSSSNSNVTVGSASGIVTGEIGGTSNITYTSTLGCSVTAIVTVNPLPSSIFGVTTNLATGYSITLSDTTVGGAWSSSNTSSSVDASGVVTGLEVGTSVITYTLETGCITTIEVTINSTPPIYGTANVCIGLTTTLSDAGTGGTWSSSNANVTIGSTGVVSGEHVGTATITYTFPSTLYTTTEVTVNSLPNPITGTDSVCQGITTTLTDAGGGTWSSSNTNASAGTSSGIILGANAGTSVITYMLPTGCVTTTIITVDLAPTAIEGTEHVCLGSGTSLSDGVGGGTWSSSNTNATMGSVSGIVNGDITGTSVITYTTSSGCVTTSVVTVNPLPTAILGTTTLVAIGNSIALSDTSSGGTWSSSNSSSSVDASGVVSGMSAGTSTITYTTAAGCTATIIVTVIATSPISGAMYVCADGTTSLSDIIGGGTWSSSNTNVMIGSTGIVSGEIAGTSIVTYTFPSTLFVTAVITVNPLPNTIAGANMVCASSSTALTDAGGGSWSSSNTNATIGSSGDLSGVIAGTSVITYTLHTGCLTTEVITVNSLIVPSVSLSPASGDTICSGTAMTFTVTPVNGGTAPAYQWKVNSTITGATSTTYSYIPSNGDIVTAILTSNATCASPATVSAADTITVIHADTSTLGITVTPGDVVCLGSAVYFTATPVNGGSSPVYTWFRNGTPQAVMGAYYGLVPANDDNIYCQLATSIRCNATDTVTSNHITMSVDTAYIPSVEILVTPGRVITSGEADTFTAVVTNGGPVVAYQWVINSTIMPGATNSVFVYNDFANNDSVTCVVTSVGACGYSSYNTVTINLMAEGVQQYTSTMGDIKLIPNPNKGQFSIKGSVGVSDEEVSIEVTDMLGQVVYKNKVLAPGGNINESLSLGNSLANGMYMLNLNAGNEHKVFHFVIEQ